MSGFILGTGSGILASAAVYYTLSTSLRESTAGLRSELHNSSLSLSNSFEPVQPPAQSSLIGPSSSNTYDNRPFSELVKQRWNATVTSLVSGVRSTDWELVGKGVYEAGQGVIERISETTSVPSSPSSSNIGSPVKETVKAHTEVAVVPGTTGLIDDVEKVPETKVGVNTPIVGVDLRKDSYGTVEGNELKEILKRNAEKQGRRLV